MPILERPTSPPARPGDILRDIGPVYLSNALVAFLFAATGPAAIILTVAARGGLSESHIASFFFGAFGLNGLISITYSIAYRQPLTFFWTIPGVVLLGPALDHLTFPEIMGAYYGTGLLMLALGVSDLVRRGMAAIPMPIVMAMVAGVFLQFGLDLVFAFRDGFWIAAPMTAVFIAISAAPRIAHRLPPLIGALLTGLVAVALQGGVDLAGETPPLFQLPGVYAPAFSWQAMVELVIPFAVTVLVVQNAQGFAILRGNGHVPPVNATTIACGVGSFFTAPFGAVPTCFTGPVTAILSGSGERHRQYTSGILVGVMAVLFGLFAPALTRIMLALPSAFIATVAGLAMLRVLETAFVTSFQGRFTLGALVTFLVTVSDITIANIGAAFWGIVLGLAASWILEREDFRG